MSEEIFRTHGSDPIALSRAWLEDASLREPNDPEAVCLATATTDGKPSLRMVLVKEIAGTGFRFHTNSNSRKGRELAGNPHAAMCFYWKSLRRQIRASGPVSILPAADSDTYFKTRPRQRQIGAWASSQSMPFARQEELQDAVLACEKLYPGDSEIPRPPYWNGYVLSPLSIEFWTDHPDRLHTRFEYTRRAEGDAWSAHWLYP